MIQGTKRYEVSRTVNGTEVGKSEEKFYVVATVISVTITGEMEATASYAVTLNGVVVEGGSVNFPLKESSAPVFSQAEQAVLSAGVLDDGFIKH